jgi:hypothetical protein
LLRKKEPTANVKQSTEPPQESRQRQILKQLRTEEKHWELVKSKRFKSTAKSKHPTQLVQLQPSKKPMEKTTMLHD